MAEPIPTSPDTPYKRTITIEADTETLKRQLKSGTSRGFTIYCDEPEAIGGDNTAPPPLSYFTMALGF